MDLSEPYRSIERTVRSILKNPYYLIAFSLAAALGALLFLFPAESKNVRASLLHADEKVKIEAFPIAEPTIRYGFALDTFQVFESEIKRGDFMGELLHDHGVDYAAIDRLAKNAEDVFSVKNLRQGKKYTILSRDSTSADYFIYEPNVYEYVVFHLKDDLQVERFEREIETKIQTASGSIESNLWNSMIDNGLSFEVAHKMEDALQWSIDFTRIEEGDEFKLVYEEDFIHGEPVGVGRVYAAYYKNIDNDYYAIYFDDEEYSGYYDLEGRPMNKGFLKSPVKASRISSYYNLNRYHPILKRVRPHLGTDYAAPYGTPILAVGDGVITRASYTKGNGNYVKIRHDKTYETQYLHMKKFAKGIRSGVHVKQGDVIGYVGSTGLATGPHVCFRFWKNGRQVNHLRLTFPPPEPLPAEYMPAFETTRDSLLQLLENAQNRHKEEVILSAAEVDKKAEAIGNP